MKLRYVWSQILSGEGRKGLVTNRTNGASESQKAEWISSKSSRDISSWNIYRDKFNMQWYRCTNKTWKLLLGVSAICIFRAKANRVAFARYCSTDLTRLFLLSPHPVRSRFQRFVRVFRRGSAAECRRFTERKRKRSAEYFIHIARVRFVRSSRGTKKSEIRPRILNVIVVPSSPSSSRSFFSPSLFSTLHVRVKGR